MDSKKLFLLLTICTLAQHVDAMRIKLLPSVQKCYSKRFTSTVPKKYIDVLRKTLANIDNADKNPYMDVLKKTLEANLKSPQEKEDSEIERVVRAFENFKEDDWFKFLRGYMRALSAVNLEDGFGNTLLLRAVEGTKLEEEPRYLYRWLATDRYVDNLSEVYTIYTSEVDIDAVKLLINAGADVNKANIDGQTPLYIVSRDGHYDIAKLLIDAGADVHNADQDGTTPLCVALAMEYPTIVQLLIDSGADVNQANVDGDTPLHFASKGNDIEGVKLLIKAGADMTKKNKDGETPLCIALAMEDNDIVQLLVDSKIDANQANRYGNTALHLASKDNDIEGVKRLIKVGADVTKKNEYGETPLHIASCCWHSEIEKILEQELNRLGRPDSTE